MSFHTFNKINERFTESEQKLFNLYPEQLDPKLKSTILTVCLFVILHTNAQMENYE